jgi:hypothetical protein
MPLAKPGRGGAEPALQVGGGGAEAGAGRADGEGLRGGGQRRAAERGKGRGRAPVLVAAVQHVEAGGRRHDRDAYGADGQSAPGLAKTRHDAAGGVETEGRAAGKHQRVDLLDGVLRRQQVGLAGRRRAAHHMHGRDRRPFAQDHGDAGFYAGVVGVADRQPGDIGEEVPHRVRLDRTPAKKNPGVAAGVLLPARRRQ